MRPIPASMSLIAALALNISAFADEGEREVLALEQQCETAREAKLKPMREAEIAKCKSDGKDAAYCERYWSDLGNAKKLPNGSWKPRLFDDLPECTRAWQARKKLNMEGK